MQAEILLPTELNEIPLCSYQKFINVADNSSDDEFIYEKMVEIFCGIDLKDVLQIKWSDIQHISIHITNVFKNKPKFQNTFTLQGVDFGFIPNIEDITFGEYIDLENNIKKMETMHKAMAVMYRPITNQHKEKYQIEEYIGTANYSEVMKYAPLGVVLGAQVFFWTLTKDLYSYIHKYLKQEMMTDEMLNHLAQELHLENNGVGIKQYMQLLTDNLQISNLSLDFLYTNALHGYLLKDKSEILKIMRCSDN